MIDNYNSVIVVAISIFFTVLLWLVAIIFLLGMYKPWIVLWFLDFKNRKMVILYYGSVLALLVLIQWIISRLGY